MTKFNRLFWPALMTLGVLLYLLLVHFLSIGNPYYIYNDTFVNLSLLIIPLGAIGSIVSIYFRYGLKKSSPVLIAWGVAAFSVVALYTGDDLSSLGWALIAYPAVIIGAILIIFYSLRSSK